MRAGRKGLAVLAALAAGCGSGAQEEPDAAPDVRQFAAHRWMRVGTSIVLPKIGRTLELVSLTNPPAVVLEGDSARCAVSGAACIRSEYRADPGENQVQSLCLICVDETGSCAGLPPASLDLEAFAPAATRGDADFFAHGEGRFYSVCHSGARLRLAPSVARLPPLMLRAVDTYGKTGPYSLSPSEIAYVEGEQCEARICSSDFSRYYALNEALFRAASEAFGPRLSAFAFGIFDGAHFDVREPHETRGGISLNRVNSTGYNNPLLNLYLAR